MNELRKKRIIGMYEAFSKLSLKCANGLGIDDNVQDSFKTLDLDESFKLFVSIERMQLVPSNWYFNLLSVDYLDKLKESNIKKFEIINIADDLQVYLTLSGDVILADRLDDSNVIAKYQSFDLFIYDRFNSFLQNLRETIDIAEEAGEKYSIIKDKSW